MTPKELDAIRARCEAATKGPWDNDVMYCRGAITWHNYGLDERLDVFVIMGKCIGDIALISNIFPETQQRANGAFIAYARQDLPACLDEIERLQTALRDLYNDCRNEPCDEQRGKVMDKARKVLEQE